MALAPKFDPEEFARSTHRCTKCGWQGLGKECMPPPNSLAACPKCGESVVRVSLDPEKWTTVVGSSVDVGDECTVKLLRVDGVNIGEVSDEELLEWMYGKRKEQDR